MMKFLNSNLYNKIDIIGFDLDGTLYDEFEFIYQVYEKICLELCNEEREKILKFMLERWLLKGSSYPYIFKETKMKFDLDYNFINNALDIFRNFKPELKISSRIKFLLERIKIDSKKMFLLTDGRKKLQISKIKALEIEKYFEFIIVAEDNQKPSPFYSKQIKKRYNNFNGSEYLYIGDRDRDEKFALNSGFKFVNIEDIKL